jgi:hypothetical protein
MSRAIALARGQAAALASMTDTCTIRRAGSASTDQSTGVRTPAYSTLYTGVCRVQQTLPISRPHDSGENFLLLARMDVQLPVSVTGLQVHADARRRISGHPHYRRLQYAIDYDLYQSLTGPSAEIGPNHNKPQGNLGHIPEYGSPTSEPMPYMAPAGEAEAPKFEKALEDLMVKALGPVFT